jgi:tetratricopeptide (TPR) repeat protein
MAGLGSKSKGIIFNWKNLIVVAAAGLVLVLRWKYALSLTAFLVFFILPLAVFYLVLPLVARRMFPAFERQMGILHMKGKFQDALDLYRKSLMLRAFGPTAGMKKLLGQTYAFLFKWSSARSAFEDAVTSPGGAHDMAVVAGYAEACFQTGYDGEAERALRRFEKSGIGLATSSYYAIHLILEDEKRRKGARDAFEAVVWNEEKDGAVRLLTLAEIEAEERALEKAKGTLKLVDRKALPPPLRPMARLLEGRILYLQKKTAEAAKILKEISKNAPSGRALLEIEDFELPADT